MCARVGRRAELSSDRRYVGTRRSESPSRATLGEIGTDSAGCRKRRSGAADHVAATSAAAALRPFWVSDIAQFCTEIGLVIAETAASRRLRFITCPDRERSPTRSVAGDIRREGLAECRR